MPTSATRADELFHRVVDILEAGGPTDCVTADELVEALGVRVHGRAWTAARKAMRFINPTAISGRLDNRTAFYGVRLKDA